MLFLIAKSTSFISSGQLEQLEILSVLLEDNSVY